jgi:hypothetical protein
MFNVWNQSIPNLEGVIEGIELVVFIDYKETEKTFQMEMEYSGKMVESTQGIDFDFVYTAEFKWEKETGVLLVYDINSDMEGSYNNTFSATFSLDVRVERSDYGKFKANFDTNMMIFALLGVVIIQTVLRRIRKR